MPRGAGEPDPSIRLRGRRSSATADEGVVVPEEVMAAMRQAGPTITCAECFDLAERMGVARRVVGEAANRAKVRIVRCQLGCFD